MNNAPDENQARQDQALRMRQALGEIMQSAARVEMRWRMLTAALLDTKYAAIVVAGQNMTWLIETALAVAPHHDKVSEEDLNTLKDLVSATKAAFSTRDRYAHSPWGSKGDETVALRSRMRRIDWEQTLVTEQGLVELAQELSRLVIEALDWTFKVLPEGVSMEAKLRWERYVRSLPPEEIDRMIAQRRKKVDGTSDSGGDVATSSEPAP